MTTMTMMGVVTQARVHHLFIGNLYPPARLYALAFDDEAPYRLEVTANMTADSAHSWIAFDANRTNVYGASLNKSAIASYEVIVAVANASSADGNGHATIEETKNVTLELRNSVAAAGACFNRTSAYVLPHPQYPRVFSASWPGPDACAMSLSTTPPPPANGSSGGGGGGILEEVVQSWRYGNTSGIHGLALDPSDGGMTIYSADLNGDALWAHFLSPDGTGRVVGLRGRYDLPDAQKGSHPRHLVVHPSGKVLYVVMEATNVVVAYAIDQRLRIVAEELSRHSLLPPGADPAAYWSAEVMLSQPEGAYLWATARAWTGRRKDPTQPPFAPHPGFISAFRLDGESGAITEQLFRVPTTTLDGIANAISPAPWSEDWAAMTDVGTGYVQMWRMERTEGDGGVVATTARDVARVNIPDGGCCANVIWYD
ncbi:carboxy-cis-cis-muconate cyclase [Apiospora kogelbergensis]|uniref:Carboxy-cis-cis-muconate cyclase n=1 Tax=Apiospora kogelbergensis TaxID=1337665 RepID=A0AAW0Q733_9PEZI